jgi:hypothetical protein
MKMIELFMPVNKWFKSVSGAMVCLLMFLFIDLNNLEESLVVKHAIVYLSLPGAYALVGLHEIVSGVPFVEISKKWDGISGWQRGVLGVVAFA